MTTLNKKIDIIIPAFNASEQISELIASLEQQTFRDFNCFIIDDNSSDNTVAIVKKNFPWANLIKLKKNVGPARAKNIGAKSSNSPYIVFLDSDTVIKDNDFLDKAVKKMEEDKNIGQLASMIVSGFDSDILLDCGIQGEGPLFGGIYHKKNINHVLDKHKKERTVLAACTAGTIIRRDVFCKSGMFDEKFYYSAEDLDIGLRVQLLGYDVRYFPELVIHHYESQAMGKRMETKTYLSHRNCLFSMLKNYPLKYALNKIRLYFYQESKLIGHLFLKNRKEFYVKNKLFFKILIFLIFNSPEIIYKRISIGKIAQKPRKYLIDIGKKVAKETSLKIPVNHLIYSITNKCNAKCRMCFQKWLNEEANMLNLDEIRNIFQNMRGLKKIILGGGEPFLRPDIDEICKILIKNFNDISITIPTNGSLPDVVYNKTKEILCSGVLKLTISLSVDGLSEYHEENRGIKNLFKRLEESYNGLINLKKIFGNRLRIQINSCFSKSNIDQIDKIHEFITQKMPEADWMLEPIRGSFDEKKASSISLSDWAFIRNKITELNNKKNMVNYNSMNKLYKYAIRTLENKTQIIPCVGGQQLISMDHIGGIAPCENFPVLANIRELNYDINNLLKENRWNEHRDKIEAKKCYCTHFCWLSQSLAKNEK